MREPYRTLFDGFETHWLLAKYLDPDFDEPDWYGLANDDRIECLSTGEKVLVDFAAAYANVGKHLDSALQYRVQLALLQVLR